MESVQGVSKTYILLELLVQLVGNFIFVKEKSEIFKHV